MTTNNSGKTGIRGGMVAAICMLAPLQLLLAAEMNSGEEDFLLDLPVMLSVTRLPQNRLELPASLSVIDRRMIEASGATSIADLFKMVAGFQMTHAGGNLSAITYHGMGDKYARRIQVLVDGRSIYMPANGGVDWVDVPLMMENIERIEVLRGPNGVAYGANAFTAVINIITRSAVDTQGIYAKYQGGGDDYNRTLVRYGGQSGNLDYRVSMEMQRDDGFDDVNFPGKPYPYSIKDDKKSKKLSVRGDYRADINDYIHFATGYNQGHRGDGYLTSGSSGNYDVDMWPAYDSYNRRHFQQIKWRHIIDTEDEFTFNLYHNYSETQSSYETALISEIFDIDPVVVELGLGIPDQALAIQQDIRAERYNLEFEHRFRVSDAVRLAWGAEARLDEVASRGYLNRDEPIKNHLYRGFGQVEWKPRPSYVVNAGMMVENNDVTGTQLSPRLALNHNFSSAHAMRVSYTRAYRTPVILEEYADHALRLSSDDSVAVQLWKSPGGLDAEEIASYEFGLMGYLGDGDSHYDFKIFKEVIDMITPVDDMSYPQPYVPEEALTFINADQVKLRGFELQLKTSSKERTMLSLGFSHIRAAGVITDEINPVVVESIERYVPSYTVSGVLDHKFGGGWQGSMSLYQTNRQKFWHETKVNILDLRLAKGFSIGGGKGKFSISAQNVNKDYYDYQDEYVIKPKVYASLELEI